jgi:hypothetical protein
MHVPSQPSSLELQLAMFRETDERAIDFNIKANFETFLVAEQVATLYRSFFDIMSSSSTERVVGVHEASRFVLGTASYYTLGMLTLLRSHVGDSYYYLRKGIELTAFARHVHSHPELLSVWENASFSKTSYKSYRDNFENKDIFKGLASLYKRYSYASRLTHSSAESLKQHIDKEGNETDGAFSWDAFSQNVSISQHIIFALETQNEIFEVHEQLFISRLQHDIGSWHRLKDDFNKSLSKIKLQTQYRDPRG